mgnify:CR=1 FL=1
MGTVDSTASSSLNALQLVELISLSFRVANCERLFTYEIIEESQKVFMSRDFKLQ